MTDKPRDDEFVPKIVYKRRPRPGDSSQYARPEEGYTAGSGEAIPHAPRHGEPIPFEQTGKPLGVPTRPPEPSGPGRPSDPTTRKPAAASRAPVTGRTAQPVAASRTPVAGRTVRSSGELARFLFVFVDLVILTALIFVILYLFRVRAWELNGSYDVVEELDAAIAGLNVMLAAATIAAIGFLFSALGMLRGTRGGRKIAVVWAWVMTLSLIGAIYGIPALTYLTAATTRERFGAGPPSGRGRVARMPGRHISRGVDRGPIPD